MKKNQKSAFTLAEVLVTLGIVGVIAALTLPALIQNYQKQQLVAQLKKGYSLVSQGIDRAMLEEKASKFSDTNVYNDCMYNGSYNCKESLGKYIKLIGYNSGSKYYNKLSCSYYYSDGNYYYNNCSKTSGTTSEYTRSTYLDTADGMRIYTKQSGSTLYLSIDVNGDEKPNVYGRDLFVFYVEGSGDGKVVPMDWDGPGAQQIIKKGWKMDY